tara:strand:+ start:101 stop:535 length:435 start_codon:yes stop_codon:yes gene_type:complete
MAFPTGATLNTANLDSSADDPSLARADILDAVTKIQDIIDSKNLADGVVVLDSSGALPSGIIPTSLVQSELTLGPLSGYVQINDFLVLNPLTKAEVLAYQSVGYTPLGAVMYCSDAHGAGAPGLVICDGTNYKSLALSGLTTLS